MRVLELQGRDHGYKKGESLPDLKPNVDFDCVLSVKGHPVGAYWQQAPASLQALAEIADSEMRRDKVPRDTMERIVFIGPTDPETGWRKKIRLYQYSARLGWSAPRHHMRHPNARLSPAHKPGVAPDFIKAMSLLGKGAMEHVRDEVPALFETHQIAREAHCHKQYTFGSYFTSTISNSNISAALHRDRMNAPGALNVIYVKRWQSAGGCLAVPAYDAVFDQPDHSMLVYPASRDDHAVTPIHPLRTGGYRNAHVFYSLRTTAWPKQPTIKK